MGNFGYLVGDAISQEALVIDPSFDARPLQAEATRLGLRIVRILVTHGHPDHVGDVARLARDTKSPVAAHRISRIPKDQALEDGDRIPLGSLSVEVIHTPGHTGDSVCYKVGDALFTGDTLFIGECGRVDLPDSDPTAMHDSLTIRLRSLDDDLIVYPGHHYGPTPTARLGDQKRDNYTMKPRKLDEFLRFIGEP